jgi:hypothetical protein
MLVFISIWNLRICRRDRICFSDKNISRNIMALSPNVCLLGYPNSLISYHSKSVLWRLNVPGINKRYLSAHVKCPIVLPAFKEIWIFSTHFRASHRLQISRKYVQWEPRWYFRKDVRGGGNDWLGLLRLCLCLISQEPSRFSGSHWTASKLFFFFSVLSLYGTGVFYPLRCRSNRLSNEHISVHHSVKN